MSKLKIVVSEYVPLVKKNYIEAVLDEAADIDELGTDYAPGSKAIAAEKGLPLFILNASGEWKEV